MPNTTSDEIEDIRHSIKVLRSNASNGLDHEDAVQILERLLKVTEDRNRLIFELAALGYA